MKDKSHFKINYEEGDGQVELEPFYRREEGLVAWKAGAAGGSALDSYEMVLPSGTRLGHRSLRSMYKQKFRSHISYRNRHDIKVKLALKAQAKQRNGVLVRSAAFAKGNSKAISSTFSFKAGAAFNSRARAIVHHWGGGGGGSHMMMAGSRQFQKGVRIRGVRLKGKGGMQQRGPQKSRNKRNRGNAGMAARQ